MRRFRLTVLAFVLALFATMAFPQKTVLKMATTTSTQDTGLLDYLLPQFEKETGISVHVIAVGSGKAIKHGENGDVEVLLVHARPDEEAFVKAGFGLYRKDVMYNDFLFVGPKTDPAKIRRAASSAEALRLISVASAPFVSRGDDSGTHKFEKKLWAATGIKPAGAWYLESGQGMGAVLLMASSKQAYTLTDRGTFLKMKDKLDLVPLYEKESSLRNQYGVIPVNPARFPGMDGGPAKTFADWITSPRVQKIIAAFGKKEFGQSLFVPNAQPGK